MARAHEQSADLLGADILRRGEDTGAGVKGAPAVGLLRETVGIPKDTEMALGKVLLCRKVLLTLVPQGSFRGFLPP